MFGCFQNLLLCSPVIRYDGYIMNSKSLWCRDGCEPIANHIFPYKILHSDGYLNLIVMVTFPSWECHCPGKSRSCLHYIMYLDRSYRDVFQFNYVPCEARNHLVFYFLSKCTYIWCKVRVSKPLLTISSQLWYDVVRTTKIHNWGLALPNLGGHSYKGLGIISSI